jgi:hypothetical protein
MLDVGRWTLDVGRWTLDVGRWTFDVFPSQPRGPFPATPTKWIYRAIYRVGNQRVGQWSKSVSITASG